MNRNTQKYVCSVQTVKHTKYFKQPFHVLRIAVVVLSLIGVDVQHFQIEFQANYRMESTFL